MRGKNSIARLGIAVTAFYAEARLPFLDAISAPFATLADELHLHIITNTDRAEEQAAIRAVVANKGVPFTIHVPHLLGHPRLLPWCHLAVFRTVLAEDPAVTHFMYLEDDMAVDKRNMDYWLQGREHLREHGCFPAFVRREKKDGGDVWYSTDIPERGHFGEMPKIRLTPEYYYLNLPYTYQGMYLLDRELMEEHLNGPSSNPDTFRRSGTRESAALGLCRAGVPQGFTARALAGFSLTSGAIDPRAFIHHLPNTYANDPESVFGKVPCDELVLL